MTLGHVLWIGGAQGSGKTSVAKLIAHRHDLRLYNADAYTYVHHERAERGEWPVLQAWDELSEEQRWLRTSPATMAELFVRTCAERFRMILGDLAALPRAPLVVVEGAHAFPAFVAPQLASVRHAVWLLVRDEVQRARLTERGAPHAFAGTPEAGHALRNRIERELRIAALIRAQAEELGFASLEIDGSLDVDTAASELEKHFAPALRQGPRAHPDERPMLRREENAAILRNLIASLGRDADATYAWVCECSQLGCDLRVEMSLAEYDDLVESGRFLVHVEHA